MEGTKSHVGILVYVMCSRSVGCTSSHTILSPKGYRFLVRSRSINLQIVSGGRAEVGIGIATVMVGTEDGT